MKWYHYLACFFAGAFLVNAIPHFVHGVSGNQFPSPVSDPPGKGLSSPLINVIWGFFNIVIGYLLFRAGKINHSGKWAIVVFFIGGLLMSIALSQTFMDKVNPY